MTDCELLELAAKAYLPNENYTNAAYMHGFFSNWNPLTDDGDALRLAVKLKLAVDTNWYNNDACWYTDTTYVSSEVSVEEEDHKNDPYAATRRAIVRAAAEIGKEMK